MTAVLRKDSVGILLRNSSNLCKSRVPFSTSFHHLYSISTEKKPKINPAVYDFLFQQHNFSPEAAAEAASVITRLRNREKSDSLFSFLEKNDFSSSHLEKIVKYKPSFISIDLEKSVKPKIKIFQELGLSNSDIADLFAGNASVFYRSTDKRVIPALSKLRGLLGSNASVVNLLMKSGRFLIRDLDKTMVPNIEFLRSRGVPMEQIITSMHCFSRFLLHKPEHVRRSAGKAEGLGARRGSRMYIHAVRVVASMSDEVWELKLQAFRSLGFADADIFNAFSKYPQAFAVSVRKMREVADVLVSTGKYDVVSVVAYPLCLASSIEMRFRPRLQVLAALEDRMLITKWPSLPTLCKLSDVIFFERYVEPYMDEVGHLFLAKGLISC
ncbi:uncharacterized protein LOC131010894 [Salvia miltiorrhiza]|uniref:uncharacterized protein LOC131010894 n=1 Tax=Salvia miltiorrhiza TaxID=226208 RepID=UPI0025AB603E|nr:uncharacterized protein LOC131010894 [Salvia miltiorrhiza]